MEAIRVRYNGGVDGRAYIHLLRGPAPDELADENYKRRICNLVLLLVLDKPCLCLSVAFCLCLLCYSLVLPLY